jgi:hypothetical protein
VKSARDVSGGHRVSPFNTSNQLSVISDQWSVISICQVLHSSLADYMTTLATK